MYYNVDKKGRRSSAVLEHTISEYEAQVNHILAVQEASEDNRVYFPRFEAPGKLRVDILYWVKYSEGVVKGWESSKFCSSLDDLEPSYSGSGNEFSWAVNQEDQGGRKSGPKYFEEKFFEAYPMELALTKQQMEDRLMEELFEFSQNLQIGLPTYRQLLEACGIDYLDRVVTVHIPKDEKRRKERGLILKVAADKWTAHWLSISSYDISNSGSLVQRVVPDERGYHHLLYWMEEELNEEHDCYESSVYNHQGEEVNLDSVPEILVNSNAHSWCAKGGMVSVR